MCGYNPKYYAKWYSKHYDKKIKEVKERQETIRQWFRNFKIGKKCKICKIEADKKHLKQFDFHHLDPETKIDDVSSMAGQGHSIESIQKEIEKCEFLCSYCHHAIT